MEPTDIVIPVHNALDEFMDCIETVTKHTKNIRFIIVDDSSAPGTSTAVQAMMSHWTNSLIIKTHKQRWFTRASNLGLRLVRTPRAVLLNSDCVVDVGWLEELYAVWDEAWQLVKDHRRDIGLVGSTLSAEEPRRWTEIQYPGYVTGHCWLVNMAVFSDMSVGRGTPGWYLDETDQRQIHIASDRLMANALNTAGYATIASFKAAVGHKGFASWGANLGAIAGLTVESVGETWS